MDSIVIVVHGGAWAIPDSIVEATRSGVKDAARRGHEVMRQGGSALDAVQAAVMTLEDDPAFNAGRGSTLNCNGEVEMDALIMDGRHLRAGSVAAVRDIAHPIALARSVMEKTDHTMLVGRGASEFGREMNLSLSTTDGLVTNDAEREFERFKGAGYERAVEELFVPKIGDETSVGDGKPNHLHDHETVGAVALDAHGNVACATSTGGISVKRPGRVGDSPIVGAGGYADNEVGAVSSTGHGESITRVCLAHRIINFMSAGLGPKAAAEKALGFMSERVQGFGGVIVVDRSGNTARVFTTTRMAWASLGGATGDRLHHGINPGEDIVEPNQQQRS